MNEIEDYYNEALNPLKEPLTKENVKTFKGLESLSDVDAEHIVQSLHKFSNILFDLITQSNSIENNNTQKLAA